MRSRFIALVTVVTVALLLPLAPAHAFVLEVKGMSHYHPTDKDFSWVAARIRTSKGARVEMHLAGGKILSDATVACTSPKSGEARGKVLGVWKIGSPGNYSVHVEATKAGESERRSKTYGVPEPPKPRWGPFEFPPEPKCHRGWPVFD